MPDRHGASLDIFHARLARQLGGLVIFFSRLAIFYALQDRHRDYLDIFFARPDTLRDVLARSGASLARHCACLDQPCAHRAGKYDRLANFLDRLDTLHAHQARKLGRLAILGGGLPIFYARLAIYLDRLAGYLDRPAIFLDRLAI
jgi:hypothetical protein